MRAGWVSLRASAIDRLRAFAALEHLALIERSSADPDPPIRAAAIRFLERADLRTRVDLGWTSLDDAERAVRIEAARVLAPLSRQKPARPAAQALGAPGPAPGLSG
jgi:hypothetical protein